MNKHLIRVKSAEQLSTLTRGDFLRVAVGATLGVAARYGGVGALLLAGQPTLAARPEVEVYPTGDFPTDVEEVNAAINGGTGPSGTEYVGGGTIRLKATNSSGVPTAFDFGTGVYPAGRGEVRVQKDVVILGERCASAPINLPDDPERDAAYPPDRTAILGGKRPFRCAVTSNPATRLRVRGLYFAQPSLSAIQVTKTAGLDVSDCVVYDVKTDETDVPNFFVALGIEASGQFQASPVLTGEFRVCDNRIFRRPPTQAPNFYFADTGIVLQLANMIGTIRGNEVTGFGFGGVGIDRNTRSVVVSDNRVDNCGYGPTSYSCGIGARGTTVPITVENNEITCGEHGPSQWSKNGIVVLSSNVTVRSNAVAGEVTQAGILLMPFQDGPVTYTGSECKLDANNLSNLISRATQVRIYVQCGNNRLTNNRYGGLTSGGVSGVQVHGTNNRLVGEQFSGSYLGYVQPCVWLTTTSSGNFVAGLRYGTPPEMAICTQVRDEGYDNVVAGLQQCPQ